MLRCAQYAPLNPCAIFLQERQALEQAEDLLKQLGVKRSIFAAPAPKSEEE